MTNKNSSVGKLKLAIFKSAVLEQTLTKLKSNMNFYLNRNTNETMNKSLDKISKNTDLRNLFDNTSSEYFINKSFSRTMMSVNDGIIHYKIGFLNSIEKGGKKLEKFIRVGKNLEYISGFFLIDLLFSDSNFAVRDNVNLLAVL